MTSAKFDNELVAARTTQRARELQVRNGDLIATPLMPIGVLASRKLRLVAHLRSGMSVSIIALAESKMEIRLDDRLVSDPGGVWSKAA